MQSALFECFSTLFGEMILHVFHGKGCFAELTDDETKRTLLGFVNTAGFLEQAKFTSQLTRHHAMRTLFLNVAMDVLCRYHSFGAGEGTRHKAFDALHGLMHIDIASPQQGTAAVLA